MEARKMMPRWGRWLAACVVLMGGCADLDDNNPVYNLHGDDGDVKIKYVGVEVWSAVDDSLLNAEYFMPAEPDPIFLEVDPNWPDGDGKGLTVLPAGKLKIVARTYPNALPESLAKGTRWTMTIWQLKDVEDEPYVDARWEVTPHSSEPTTTDASSAEWTVDIGATCSAEAKPWAFRVGATLQDENGDPLSLPSTDGKGYKVPCSKCSKEVVGFPLRIACKPE